AARLANVASMSGGVGRVDPRNAWTHRWRFDDVVPAIQPRGGACLRIVFARVGRDARDSRAGHLAHLGRRGRERADAVRWIAAALREALRIARARTRRGDG